MPSNRKVDESVVKDIEKIRKIIKRKHRAITLGYAERQEQLEKEFKPIVEPLKKLTESFKHEREHEDQVKEEANEEKMKQENVNYIESKEENYNQSSPSHMIQRFIDMAIKDTDNKLDHIYGVKYVDGEWIIGNKPIDFQGNRIVIDDKKYKATYGLLQLLFLKKPKVYNKADLHTYREILLLCKAHLTSQGFVKSNRSEKYKNIIAQIFKPKRSKRIHKNKHNEESYIGEGIMTVDNTKKLDYVYWDDPNELCDRLRLLIDEQNAGHTGHNNEIMSILEELREAGIIKGDGRIQLHHF